MNGNDSDEHDMGGGLEVEFEDLHFDDEHEEIPSAFGFIVSTAKQAAFFLGGQRYAWQLLAYATYLIVLTVVALEFAANANAFDQNNALRQTFERKEVLFTRRDVIGNFRGISSPEDWWDWVQGPLVAALSGAASRVNALEVKIVPGYVAGSSRILGMVRLRQVRVDPDEECAARAARSGVSMSCFPRFSQGKESTTPFGNYSLRNVTGKPNDPTFARIGGAFEWMPDRALGENSFVGRWDGTSYPGSGYAQALPEGVRNASAVLTDLRNAGWIDLGTRLVLVDMTVYNPGVSLLTLIKLSCELPSAGGASCYMTLRTAGLSALVPEANSAANLLPEIFLLSATVAYVVVEAWKAWEGGVIGYWLNLWSFMEWLSFLTFLASFYYRLRPFGLVSESGFPPRPGQFVNYEPPMFAVSQWQNLIAFTTLITWIKLFRHFRSVIFMRRILTTLSKAVSGVIPLAVILGVGVWAFAIAHCLIFAGTLSEFETTWTSFVTLYRVLLGFDTYDRLRDADPFLGPAMFVIWTISGTFIITNLFFAVLTEADIGVANSGDNAGGVLDTAMHMWDSYQAARKRRMELVHLTAAIRSTRERLKAMPKKAVRTKEEALLCEALEMSKEKAIHKLLTANERLQAEREAHEERQEKRFDALDMRVARIVAASSSLSAVVHRKEQIFEEKQIASRQPFRQPKREAGQAKHAKPAVSISGAMFSATSGKRTVDNIKSGYKR